MKRQLCNTCAYPKRVCICKHISPVACQERVVVLQHPQEAKHAKNSARLIPLCMATAEILVGEKPQDFASLQAVLKHPSVKPCVFYPSQSSKIFEQHINHYQADKFNLLIFIDATWRKAFKMWHLNSWLHELPNWHFDNPPSSQYHIRTTKLNNAISTLEAVSYALDYGHNVNSEPLLRLFNAMQSERLAFTPQTE